MRVAYTLEQCWHRVPGGTAVAALRIAEELRSRDDVDLVGVAGRHRNDPDVGWRPAISVEQLPIRSPWLYETWLRAGWPKVERATGPIDIAHATTIIPCPSHAPVVVTVHDLAFLHQPEHFTAHGVRVFERSLRRIREHAAMVLCSSEATRADCSSAGIDDARLRVVPLGVVVAPATSADVRRVRGRHELPERFVLFVGTVEPRKNLRRLAGAVALLDEEMTLVVVGAEGWGDGTAGIEGDVRFLGFVDDADVAGLYAAATVFCYPSLREGFGLPVLEAMAQGTPVVTSAGTSTEEVAGGAAELVDPLDVDSIAAGITRALQQADDLIARGRVRAASHTWARTAQLTVDAYRAVLGTAGR